MYLTLVSQKHQIWLQICLCWICLENLKKKDSEDYVEKSRDIDWSDCCNK